MHGLRAGIVWHRRCPGPGYPFRLFVTARCYLPINVIDAFLIFPRARAHTIRFTGMARFKLFIYALLSLGLWGPGPRRAWTLVIDGNWPVFVADFSSCFQQQIHIDGAYESRGSAATIHSQATITK